MGLWYLKLEYFEMEEAFGFLIAGSSNTHQKSFREAVRFNVSSHPEDIIEKLRALADKIEQRIKN